MIKKITLATLAQTTEQEVMDHIVNHLLTQKKQANNPNTFGECMYRTPDSLSCAAGCLIDDAEYSKEFEDINWKALIRSKLVPPNHGDLIDKTQRIHDCIPPGQWAKELKAECARQGLQFNPPMQGESP